MSGYFGYSVRFEGGAEGDLERRRFSGSAIETPILMASSSGCGYKYTTLTRAFV